MALPARASSPAGVGLALAGAALPVVALVVAAVSIAAVLLAGRSAGTLGYDYLAYDAAARRLLAGQPLYDTSYEAAGGFGLFYYPPPFILLVLPFAALLGPEAATWAWIGGLIAAFAVGLAILPVRREVKWAILLLAGLQWPFLYALKLGQVGPLLFLVFAVGWRWIDRPSVLGGAAAVGTLAKLQPAVLLVWAVLARRWRSLAVGLGAIVAVAAVTTAVAGLRAWQDFVTLIGRVADPITTPHNFTPGAVAFQLGLPAGWAAGVQVASTVLVLAAVGVAALRLPAARGYLVAVVASQLLSPVLWDHYAMLLLLAVAWLLERRQWWAALIPISQAAVLVGVTPAVAYPIGFFAALLGPFVVDGDAGARA